MFSSNYQETVNKFIRGDSNPNITQCKQMIAKSVQSMAMMNLKMRKLSDQSEASKYRFLIYSDGSFFADSQFKFDKKLGTKGPADGAFPMYGRNVLPPDQEDETNAKVAEIEKELDSINTKKIKFDISELHNFQRIFIKIARNNLGSYFSDRLDMIRRMINIIESNFINRNYPNLLETLFIELHNYFFETKYPSNWIEQSKAKENERKAAMKKEKEARKKNQEQKKDQEPPKKEKKPKSSDQEETLDSLLGTSPEPPSPEPPSSKSKKSKKQVKVESDEEKAKRLRLEQKAELRAQKKRDREAALGQQKQNLPKVQEQVPQKVEEQSSQESPKIQEVLSEVSQEVQEEVPEVSQESQIKPEFIQIREDYDFIAPWELNGELNLSDIRIY